ncbi:MAG: urate oxidase [Micromonosporaceae bacterium]|nr:urate oxidase [Micromonosporaceae bacterium]
MAIVLGNNSYGKAETRLVRLRRESDEHELTDLNVSVALGGDLAAAHESGDNSNVLPTDTQKNTVYAFARSHGVDQIEEFGLLLARHFVDSQPSISVARVSIEEYGWRRLGPHSFVRTGEGTRTAAVTYDGQTAWVVSGVSGLVLLNSTDSEFHGFIRDEYTTLAETRDRILATEVNADWRHASAEDDWKASYEESREELVRAFVRTYSRSLQQTLHAMGRAVLYGKPNIAEVRLSLPNKHHFLVDLEPFGRDNPGEVFYAADRPYGLIEGTVLRDEAPPAGLAWGLPQ